MPLNVLIVDDSPAMRSFIRRALQMSGLEITQCLEASQGAEALSILRKNWIDIVLTDINMPEMNGEQLMRNVESDELLRSIPVIVVSTDASDQRIRQMYELGAKSYVRKPFAPETIRTEIERILETSHGN